MTATATTAPAHTNVTKAVPFFRVADMQASLRFYIDGLGFEKTKEWTPHGTIEWCWLELGPVSHMLQQYRPGKLPDTKRGEGVSIAYQCNDALAIYRQALANGLNAQRPFVGNNMWVVILTDPDGYKLDFESPTDVPEETVYDEPLHSK